MPEDMTLEIQAEINKHKKDLKRAEAGLLEYKEQHTLGVAAFESRIRHHCAVITALEMFYVSSKKPRAQYATFDKELLL